MIMFGMYFFDDNKLKFQVWKKSVMFEAVKNPLEELWHSAGVQEDVEVSTVAGSLIKFLMCLFDDNKLKFQVS